MCQCGGVGATLSCGASMPKSIGSGVAQELFWLTALRVSGLQGTFHSWGWEIRSTFQELPLVDLASLEVPFTVLVRVLRWRTVLLPRLRSTTKVGGTREGANALRARVECTGQLTGFASRRALAVASHLWEQCQSWSHPTLPTATKSSLELSTQPRLRYRELGCQLSNERT